METRWNVSRALLPDMALLEVENIRRSFGGLLALLVFAAAAKNLKAREQWIGWTPAQKRRRVQALTIARRRSKPTTFQYTSLRSSRLGTSGRTAGCCTPSAREHQNQSVSQRQR